TSPVRGLMARSGSTPLFLPFFSFVPALSSLFFGRAKQELSLGRVKNGGNPPWFGEDERFP
ncbi:MAG: hypothetical protein WCH57_09295, partial [Verrucomicrobiota bacterium]